MEWWNDGMMEWCDGAMVGCSSMGVGGLRSWFSGRRGEAHEWGKGIKISGGKRPRARIRNGEEME